MPLTVERTQAELGPLLDRSFVPVLGGFIGSTLAGETTTIGRGGSAVASGGEPTYATIDYVGADYQQFTGRTVLFDTSVGYQPPQAAPNDDGTITDSVRADLASDADLVFVALHDREAGLIQFAYYSEGGVRREIIPAQADVVRRLLPPARRSHESPGCCPTPAAVSH
jgi:hypothetical protein